MVFEEYREKGNEFRIFFENIQKVKQDTNRSENFSQFIQYIYQWVSVTIVKYMYENIYSEHKFSTVGINVNQTFINLSTYNVVCYEKRLLHMHE